MIMPEDLKLLVSWEGVELWESRSNCSIPFWCLQCELEASPGFESSTPLSANVPNRASLSLFPFQMNSAARQQPQFGGKYEQPGFAPPGYPHSFHAPPGSPGPRRPEGPAPRKGRLGAHPYSPDSRHFGRERFGDSGPDYGRGKRDEYGFDERGHEAEHHYRSSREEHYDRHRDSWSYEYRRESYREAKWHSARH